MPAKQGRRFGKIPTSVLGNQLNRCEQRGNRQEAAGLLACTIGHMLLLQMLLTSSTTAILITEGFNCMRGHWPRFITTISMVPPSLSVSKDSIDIFLDLSLAAECWRKRFVGKVDMDTSVGTEFVVEDLQSASVDGG